MEKIIYRVLCISSLLSLQAMQDSSGGPNVLKMMYDLRSIVPLTPTLYNQQDPEGKTALSYTASVPQDDRIDFTDIDETNAKMAAWLILKGARIDIPDKDGKTPLNYAQELQDKIPTVLKVIKIGEEKLLQEKGKDKTQISQLTISTSLLVDSTASVKWLENVMQLYKFYAQPTKL